MRRMHLWFAVAVLFSLASCQAFIQPETTSLIHQKLDPIHKPRHTSQLDAGLFGPKETNESKGGYDPSLPKRIIEIPVKTIKTGGLRFALGLHLVGLQNTPDTGSWRANQASETILEMYFRDDSAKFSVVLEDSCIAVDRYGQPSLPYLLQESLILHSVLDELNTLAFEGEIEAENRLFQLEKSSNSIEKARGVLPACPG